MRRYLSFLKIFNSQSMELTVPLFRLLPSRGIVQWIRLYRAVRQEGKQNPASTRLARGKRESVQSHPFNGKSSPLREVRRNSIKSYDAATFKEGAERNRVSAGFSGKRREERQRYPEGSPRSRINS